MKNADLLSEYIDRMIKATDKATETSQKLHRNPAPKDFEKLNGYLQEVKDHLATLQSYLNHQDDYILDEFSDWLSTTVAGKHTEFRHLPRLKVETTGREKND